MISIFLNNNICIIETQLSGSIGDEGSPDNHKKNH